MLQASDILDFWFGQPNEPGYGKPQEIWFTKKPEFDQLIRTRFLEDYEKAAAGHMDEWVDLPETCLALILLLDQFPRNMFRGTDKAFATDWEALSAAQQAVKLGFDREFLPVQRWFLYCPFEHSESLEHQCFSVKLFHQLSNDLDSASAIDYAIRHKEVIERFGRFPHRNAILGRTSTKEEKEFLKHPGSSF